MTVTEYRKKHPDCAYCDHSMPVLYACLAVNKRKSKRRAKKCPCYVPKKWEYETDKKGGAE